MDNDICLHCNHNISENDKRMEMPCCETVYHTTCAKNMINDAVIDNYNNIICSCGELFISLNIWNHNNITENTNTVIPEEACLKIANLKESLSKFKKNRIIFKKKIKEESTCFKEEVKPLIEQIKERKKSIIQEIKENDLYKNINSSARSLKIKLNNIVKSFGFDRSTILREIFGGKFTLYYLVKYYLPTRDMLKDFRLGRL